MGTPIEFLRQKIEQHRSLLCDILSISNRFLTHLIQVQLIDLTECLHIQTIPSNSDKVEYVLNKVTCADDNATYRQFLQALYHSGQTEIEDLLSSFGTDTADLDENRENLESFITEWQNFNVKEQRRSGLNSGKSDEVDAENTLSSDIGTKPPSVAEATRLICSQFDRTKVVIEKLHADCNNVARINSDIMTQVQTCREKIKENLHFRKKGQPPPQRSQEVFEQLVKDISELTKEYNKEIAKDTDSKTPCFKLIHQCDEHVTNRIKALKGYSNVDEPKPGKIPARNLPKMSAEDNSAPELDKVQVNHLEDSLKSLEDKLKKYISLELRMTDDYRRVLRIQNLQRSSQSDIAKRLREIGENLLLTETPENKVYVHKTYAFLDSFCREYDECLTELQRSLKSTREEHNSQDSSHKKNKRYRGPKVNSSKRGNFVPLQIEPPAKPELFPLLKHLLSVQQKLKDEIGSLKSKYQADLDRRRREFEAFRQKEVMENEKLLVLINELTAEKDKFKRLYDSTKVSFIHKSLDYSNSQE